MKVQKYKLQVIFIKEKDSIIAFCPALELSTCGESVEEAQRMFQEAAEAFFESCTERWVLDDLGWERIEEDDSPSWVPPHIINNAAKEISVPV